MFEMWQFLVAMAIAVLGVPTAGFAVLALFEGFPKIRLGQIAGIVAVLAWVFALASAGPWNEGPVLAIGATFLILVFLATWSPSIPPADAPGDDEFLGRWGSPRLVPRDRAHSPHSAPGCSGRGPLRAGPSSSACRVPGTDVSPPRRPKSNPWDDDDVHIARRLPASRKTTFRVAERDGG